MNKKIIGYGASTKGNVILQFCGINNKLMPYIVDVNPDKRNKYTPGTNIKIINDLDLKKKKFDYLIVLPWHFRDYCHRKRKKLFKRRKKVNISIA